MASNLYDVLGVERNATTEQIRKAYKKRALATHPDRFSSKSEEEKAQAEVRFREVASAYEVLSDSSNRRLYDMHGVWPPPEEYDAPPPRRERRHTSQYHQHFHHPHHDTFYFARPSEFFHGMPHHRPGHGHHHHGHMPPRQHADPFEVFNTVFGDFDRHFKHMFPAAPPFPAFPDEPRMGMPRMPHDLPGLFIPSMPDMFSHSSPHGFPGSAGGHPGVRQETRVTTTINGVTESTWTRTDENGNEHITHTYPDGREKYTINGIEQVRYPPVEPFVPPAPPQILGSGYPPPPIANAPSQRPSPTRHHSWERDGPYNPAPPVHTDRDHWHHSEGHKRHWWRPSRR